MPLKANYPPTLSDFKIQQANTFLEIIKKEKSYVASFIEISNKTTDLTEYFDEVSLQALSPYLIIPESDYHNVADPIIMIISTSYPQKYHGKIYDTKSYILTQNDIEKINQHILNEIIYSRLPSKTYENYVSAHIKTNDLPLSDEAKFSVATLDLLDTVRTFVLEPSTNTLVKISVT